MWHIWLAGGLNIAIFLGGDWKHVMWTASRTGQWQAWGDKERARAGTTACSWCCLAESTCLHSLTPMPKHESGCVPPGEAASLCAWSLTKTYLWQWDMSLSERHNKGGCVEEGKQEQEKEQDFIVVNVGLLVLDQYIDQYSLLGAAKLVPQADILVHRSQNIVNTQYTVYSSFLFFAWTQTSCFMSPALHVQCGWLCEGCSGAEHAAANSQWQAMVQKGKQQTVMYKQEYAWETYDALLSYWPCFVEVCDRKPVLCRFNVQSMSKLPGECFH